MLLLPAFMAKADTYFWIECESTTFWSVTSYYLGSYNFTADTRHIQGNYSVFSQVNGTSGVIAGMKAAHIITNITDMPVYDYWIRIYIYVPELGAVRTSGTTIYAPMLSIDNSIGICLLNSSTQYYLNLVNNPDYSVGQIRGTIVNASSTMRNLATWYQLDLHYAPSNVELFVNGTIDIYHNATYPNQKPTTFNICNSMNSVITARNSICTDYVVFSDTQGETPVGPPPPVPPVTPPYTPPYNGTIPGSPTSIALAAQFATGVMPYLIVALVPAAALGKYAGMLGVFLGLVLGVGIMAYLGMIPMWIIYLLAIGLSLFFVNRVRSSGGGGEAG